MAKSENFDNFRIVFVANDPAEYTKVCHAVGNVAYDVLNCPVCKPKRQAYDAEIKNVALRASDPDTTGHLFKSEAKVEDPFDLDELDLDEVNKAVLDYEKTAVKKESKKQTKKQDKSAPVPTVEEPLRYEKPISAWSLRDTADHIARTYSRKVKFIDYDAMVEAIYEELKSHVWDDELNFDDLWDTENSDKGDLQGKIEESQTQMIRNIWALLNPWEDTNGQLGPSRFVTKMYKIIDWYVVAYRMTKY